MSERFKVGYKVRLKLEGAPWMRVHVVEDNGWYVCSYLNCAGVVVYQHMHHDLLDPIAEVPVSTLPPPTPYSCGEVHFGPFDVVDMGRGVGAVPVLSCQHCSRVIVQRDGRAYQRAAQMRAMVCAIKADALAHAAKSKQ